MKTITLTESQRTLLATSLRVAAEKYNENADYIRKAIKAGEHVAGSERVAKQFDSQFKDAMELANLIDNAESVEVKE
jgi:hypothetical protein